VEIFQGLLKSDAELRIIRLGTSDTVTLHTWVS